MSEYKEINTEQQAIVDDEFESFISQYKEIEALFSPTTRTRLEKDEQELTDHREGEEELSSRLVSETDEKKVYPQEVKSNTVLTLTMRNLKKMQAYYTWSQDQTYLAFNLAVLLSIAGFALMAGAILCSIVYNLKTEVATMAAICGAVTELIAATALYVYKSSMDQMEHYHKALHEDQRFLSSVYIAQGFTSTKSRELLLSEIVHNQLTMNQLEVQLAALVDLKPDSEKKKDQSTEQDSEKPKDQVLTQVKEQLQQIAEKLNSV